MIWASCLRPFNPGFAPPSRPEARNRWVTKFIEKEDGRLGDTRENPRREYPMPSGAAMNALTADAQGSAIR